METSVTAPPRSRKLQHACDGSERQHLFVWRSVPDLRCDRDDCILSVQEIGERGLTAFLTR